MLLSLSKQTAQRLVRGFHARFFDRGLPDRIALLGHELPSQYHRAFREMAAFFKQQGYVFTDAEGLQSQRYPKCVMFSFDDCFRDWFESLGLFDDLSIKVTFYVNTLPLRGMADEATISQFRERTGAARGFEPLSCDELVVLRARGHTVGSHTHSHFDLASLLLDKARDEIRIGKVMLQRIIGERVDHFAYPYGMRRHFTPALRATCREYGFKTIASGIPGRLHGGPSSGLLHRTQWRFEQSLEHNLQSLRIDGRLFERITGRSAVG